MNLEEELRRQLRAQAAGVRAEPDLDRLGTLIHRAELRAARRGRLAVTLAAVLAAASLGTLAGTLLSRPVALHPTITPTAGKGGLGGGTTRPPARHVTAPAPPRTIVSEQLAGGVSVTATLQPLGYPVGIESASGAFSSCAHGDLVTTSVGGGSSLGVGTGVSGLLPLGPGGLEVLSSGTVPTPTGDLWWLTVAVGSDVSRLAAEGGSGIVTATPSSGIAVLAGTGASAGASVSAVGEDASGRSLMALQVLLGAGPKVVGQAGATPAGVRGGAAGCSPVRLAATSSAAGQPPLPALAAEGIIVAYERAFSPDPWQGYASNLAAVADAAKLGYVASSSDGAVTTAPAHAAPPAAGGMAVSVRQVVFQSPRSAQVVYELSDGIWRVGTVRLGGDGTWRVSLDSYCAAVSSGAVLSVPASVAGACTGSGASATGTGSAASPTSVGPAK